VFLGRPSIAWVHPEAQPISSRLPSKAPGGGAEASAEAEGTFSSRQGIARMHLDELRVGNPLL
jgi:hypothetical protein